MARKLNFTDQMSLIEQARENRDGDWEEQEEELNRQLRAREIEEHVYWDWVNENPRPSEVAQDQLAERRRMKRKSKRNVKAKIEIIDHDAMGDVKLQGTSIEWSSDFDEGSLVETRDGDVGIIMEQHDLVTGRPIRPRHVKAAMADSYIRVLVNGEVQWHTKVSVSSLSDS